MTTDPDTILLEAEDSMQKALTYLAGELRGLRAGRASPAMVEFVKVDYYGSPTEIKSLAVVSTPEPTQLLIKPFDATSIGAIRQAIEDADLGLNPQVEDKQIRISVPALSTERRNQLTGQAKKIGEEQKVALRNTRRDANKHADALAKGDSTSYSEDEIKTLHTEIQDLLKKYESQIDAAIKAKTEEIMTV
ncbi:MAG: ribosome recycling factor [Planctomycetota bacterium]